MGWERKRGKLDELNALLRGSTTTEHPDQRGGRARRRRRTCATSSRSTPTRGCRVVSVARLVGTIAHPLNQPTLRCRRRAGDARLRRAPAADHPDAARREHGGSIFQRIFAGSAGIDPYASAVSDVYQDLFEEGSFTGKGIYDVDAFAPAMADRVPENALLSHDLFEGVFARAGLVTDVEFFDEFPSNYLVAAARQHRWARGDWQLLPWILGRAAPRAASAEPELDRRRRPLEDGRQPAPDAVRPARPGHPGRRLDGPVGVGRVVDGVRRGVVRRARGAAGRRAGCCRAAAASRSAAICAPLAATSLSPRRTSASASRSSPTRRG